MKVVNGVLLLGDADVCNTRLNMPPFMSYVAYSTYNYRFADPSIGTSQYSNLRLVRAFEYGLDPSSSEAGFVSVKRHNPHSA